MYSITRTLALALFVLFGLVALAQATTHSPLSSSHSRKSLAFRKKPLKELDAPTLKAREREYYYCVYIIFGPVAEVLRSPIRAGQR